MQKVFVILLSLVACISQLCAQRDSLSKYDRPSLCEMMVSRGGRIFEREVEQVFRNAEIPERFNDHSLGVKLVRFATNEQNLAKEIQAFSCQQEIAKKMVSKWFSRNKQTGHMDIHLLAERGLYNADKIDVALAKLQVRGIHILEDAGEKLIHRTFLVVHDYVFDYRYTTFVRNTDNPEEESDHVLDLSQKSAIDWYNSQLYKNDLRLANITVGCVSYLFQLQWTDEVAATFYQLYYTSKEECDQQKIAAFKADHTTFQLDYLGKYESSITERNNYRYSNQQLVQKVCVRLVDQNLAALQHTFPQFRIKARLLCSTEEGEQVLKAYIGKKEELTSASKFEVLEPELHDDGTYTYNRIGIIQPISEKIWDNRYMATDEIESVLDATYFKQISGGEILPGMLIREIGKR